MNRNLVRLATLTGATCALLGLTINQATATTSVTIANPSFETPTLVNPGDYAYFPPIGSAPGWISDGIDLDGIQHPAGHFPLDGYDGANVMFIHSASGAHQTISGFTLQPFTELTLSALVGADIYVPVPKADLTLRLTFDNQTVIPTPINTTSPDLTTGGFVTWTRTYLIPGDGIVNGVDVVDQNVTIELESTFGSSSYFDLVQLDETTVPEPGVATMIVLGGGLVFAWRRTRRTS